ncbi:MAG: DUF302 domain-containing protein [Flavobacteriaceae bacterium]|nr:DUF302 domain-containing protein [Flavobacteriaceae bacterium]
MSYFISRTMKDSINFEQAIENVTAELKKEGFGILTKIDIKSTFKKKLNVDVNQYVILGACNPNYAYDALKEDSKLGVFLPCNIIVEELSNGTVEVSAIDPVAAMMAVNNEQASIFANDVLEKMKTIIGSLGLVTK